MNNKTKRIAISIITAIPSLMVGIGAISMIIGTKQLSEIMTNEGVVSYMKILGILELIYLALFLYPKTMKLGFLLLSCHFAGAMGINLSHGSVPIGPAIPLVITWIAALLRDRSIFFQLHSTKA